jgi:hypothetical protein
MFAWNPLELFDLVGNAHNDVAMLLLLLLGLVAITRKTNWLLGIGLMTLSALVKYMTGIAALLWTVAWVAQGPTRHQRLRRLAGSVGLGLGLAVVTLWPWVQTPQALVALGDAAGGKLVLNSAPDLVALTVADQILQRAGIDPQTAETAARFWIRLLTRALFVAYLGWELHRLWRAARHFRDPSEGKWRDEPAADEPSGATAIQTATLQASTRALLILPLLVFTWVWSWYFSCSLALAALLGWKSGLSRVVVAYTVLGLPIVYAHQYLNQDMPGAFVLVFALGPLALPLAARLTRVASGQRRNRSRSQPVTDSLAGRSSDP